MRKRTFIFWFTVAMIIFATTGFILLAIFRPATLGFFIGFVPSIFAMIAVLERCIAQNIKQQIISQNPIANNIGEISK